MFPTWLYTLAVIWLSLAVISAVVLFVDIKYFRPQSMKIMTLAWPINALYFSFIALIAYFWFGRAAAERKQPLNSRQDHAGGGMAGMHHESMPMKHGSMPMAHAMGTMQHCTMHMGAPITWKGIFRVSTHCGAGCTLADIVGEIAFLFFPFALFGSAIYGSWILDCVLALLLGIYFQYLPGREMGLAPLSALKKAIQADTLSVISWQIGMCIWMSLVFFVFFTPDIPRFSVVYWFMMQIAMICGFFTAYPVNWILSKKGIKHVM